MKLFFSYIWSHRKSLLLFLMVAGVFALVFFLYELPLEPVLYAALLCLVGALILCLIGFFRYKRRHAALISGAARIRYDAGLLPEPRDLIERDYHALVTDLSAALREQEAQGARRAAEQSDYYTLWAHQIKTPIAAMDLLLQSVPANAPRDEELREQLFRVDQYVGMALQFVRVEEGSDLQLAWIRVDDAMKLALKKLARSFSRKKLALRYEPCGLVVLSDLRWLSFVFEQLLSNALKYTNVGGVTITSEGDTLTIRDSGIGVAAEDLPRLGEKGFTGYNGRADQRSTGVGLYLVKKVLHTLGHELSIRSEVGKGTAVTLRFPEQERASD